VFRWVFLAAFGFLALSLLFLVLMEERPLRTTVMPADPTIPISRNAIKWVDGIDNRPLQDTPSYAPGVGARQGGAGRQGGGPPAGAGQRGR